jgi:hypothetical protein
VLGNGEFSPQETPEVGQMLGFMSSMHTGRRNGANMYGKRAMENGHAQGSGPF